MKIPTVEELCGQQYRDYMTANAPDCANCGEHALIAERMPEVDRIGQIELNGDRVISALEIYRCSACGKRTYLRVELDRITRKEQDAETEKAIQRAKMYREEPFLLALVRPNAWRREVQRRIPSRSDPDLRERWLARRASDTGDQQS